MTLTELILLKYALAPLALIGSVVSFLALRLVRSDLRAIEIDKVNGGKRYSTIARFHQAAFLLTVSVVLLIIGLVLWISPVQPRAFYALPQVIVVRIGLDIIAALLLCKQIIVRQTRVKLDEYYDAQQKATHAHRRATDPPELNQKHLRNMP
jgi:magnesium-transporting ATPase (P-type)